MTATERADATTSWKECVAPDGRTFYHNKDTKESKWSLPEELRVVREAAMRAEAEIAKVKSARGARVTAAAAGQAREDLRRRFFSTGRARFIDEALRRRRRRRHASRVRDEG